MIQNLRRRSAPMFLNIVIINILIFKIWENASNSSLKVFFIGYCISYTILFFGILLKRKYSVHVASVCSAIPLFVNQTTTYYLNPFYILPALLLIIGLVASSRLYLRAHTNVEIIVGALIGFVPSFILFYKMQKVVFSYQLLAFLKMPYQTNSRYLCYHRCTDFITSFVIMLYLTWHRILL